MPSARKLMAVPLTIWSVRRWMEKYAWTSASAAPATIADEEAADPAVGLVRAPGAEERAHEHHALEPDVHDTAPLGEHPAERGEEKRRRQDQRQRDEGRPRDDVREVPSTRAGDGDAAEHPDQAARDREPAGPARPLVHRPGAGRDPEASDDERHGDRTGRDRRQRDPQRDDAQSDSRSRDVPRGHQPLREDLGVRAHSGLSRRGCSRSFLPFVHR